MRCGLLMERIDIYRPATTQNEYGEIVQDYKIWYCMRARAVSNRSSKALVNIEISYPYRKVFDVPQYVDVRETDLIHWMGKKYRILSIELDRTQMKKVITTEEVDE
mgnify:CR=1 FL=1